MIVIDRETSLIRPAEAAGMCRVVTAGQLAELNHRRRDRPVRNALATRSGIVLFGLILAAQDIWRRLTAKQRQALVDSYRAALAGAEPGQEIPLPALVEVHPATVAALVRRGLVEDGRLTPAAVDVVAYRPLPEPGPPGSGAQSRPPTTPGGPP